MRGAILEKERIVKILLCGVCLCINSWWGGMLHAIPQETQTVEKSTTDGGYLRCLDEPGKPYSPPRSGEGFRRVMHRATIAANAST